MSSTGGPIDFETIFPNDSTGGSPKLSSLSMDAFGISPDIDNDFLHNGSPKPLDFPEFSRIESPSMDELSLDILFGSNGKESPTGGGSDKTKNRWAKDWKAYAQTKNRLNEDNREKTLSTIKVARKITTTTTKSNTATTTTTSSGSKKSRKRKKRRRRPKKPPPDKFFGITHSHRITVRRGRIAYWKIKVKHASVEYYVGTADVEMEAVLLADAVYFLVGEFKKCNAVRSQKKIAAMQKEFVTFREYVSRVASTASKILKSKLTIENKEKVKEMWRKGLELKWASSLSPAHTSSSDEYGDVEKELNCGEESGLDENVLRREVAFPLLEVLKSLRNVFDIDIVPGRVEAFLSRFVVSAKIVSAKWQALRPNRGNGGATLDVASKTSRLPESKPQALSESKVASSSSSSLSVAKSSASPPPSLTTSSSNSNSLQGDVFKLRREHQLLSLMLEKQRQQLLIQKHREMLREQEERIRHYQMGSVVEEGTATLPPPSTSNHSTSSSENVGTSLTRSTSYGSLPRQTVRKRCQQLFTNESHDPRLCFECAHCDHAAWSVSAETTLGDESNPKKRRAVESSTPLLEAINRNRVYYHGLKEEYKLLEYPFCSMDDKHILATKRLFRHVSRTFNRRYSGRSSPEGAEELLVLQIIEMQKTINDVYLNLAEGERVVTDGVLGRCTIRHFSRMDAIFEKHATFLTPERIPGIFDVIKLSRALRDYLRETNDEDTEAAPTSRVVIAEREKEDPPSALARDLKEHFFSV